MENKPGIYQILNKENNKMYIGSSIKILTRIKRHKTQLMENKHHSRHLQRAYNKNKSIWEFNVLEYCEKENLLKREQHYLNILLFATEDNNKFSEYGYNISRNAENTLGIKWSIESKKNQSLRMINSYRNGSLTHPRLGTRNSEKSRKKHSIKMKEYYKDNIHPMKGLVHTKSSKEKMRIANSGENSALFGKKGKDHPCYGKQLSGKDHHCYGKPAKNSKKITLLKDNVEYNFSSIKTAADFLGVNRRTLSNKNNINYKGYLVKIED
jgi:group I intron endonuclease